MTAHIFIKVQTDGLDGGRWEFEVKYLKEHGGTQEDILGSDVGLIEHTSLYQLYLKATLEAMLYINSLAERIKPSTREVTIHMPCEGCIKLLQENETEMLTPRARAKVKRGYKQFVTAINIEAKQWKVNYELSKEIETHMTTSYPSKEIALLAGIRFAGRAGEITTEDLRPVEGKINQFGRIHEESELFEFENGNGLLARIGVGPLRRKYWELWLIDPETGQAVRT